MTDEMNKILLVDMDIELISELSAFLSGEDFHVTTACNGEEALLRIYADVPDIMILGVVLEDYTGYEMYRLLQSYPETADIAVIFSSRIPTVHQDLCARFNRGYQSLGKPPDRDMLKKILIELKDKRALPGRNGTDKARTQAAGINDEKLLQSHLEEEIIRAERFSRPLSSLRIEILWKSPGEEESQFRELFMKESAEVIKKSLRTIDSTARIGTGGFLSLLPHTEKSSALAYGQKIKNNIVEHAFPPEIDASDLHVAMVMYNYDGKGTISPGTIRGKLEEAILRAIELKSTHIAVL
jgi:PleD family two-component response regulator